LLSRVNHHLLLLSDTFPWVLLLQVYILHRRKPIILPHHKSCPYSLGYPSRSGHARSQGSRIPALQCSQLTSGISSTAFRIFSSEYLWDIRPIICFVNLKDRSSWIHESRSSPIHANVFGDIPIKPNFVRGTVCHVIKRVLYWRKGDARSGSRQGREDSVVAHQHPRHQIL